jgi:hypothetical protein
MIVYAKYFRSTRRTSQGPYKDNRFRPALDKSPSSTHHNCAYHYGRIIAATTVDDILVIATVLHYYDVTTTSVSRSWSV